ncbi:MAG: YgeY family selenium metabolism-linked hydrolase [Candidatus Heimdallarchaeota archaeon]
MKKEIKKIVEANKESIIKLTQKLIGIKSITGNEGEIINAITEEMKNFGFDEIKIDEMGNLIGKIGNGDKVLAVDGHVDTVEIGKERDWKFNPLGGTIYNGNIYGRGSCDQKGGLTTSLLAIKILKEIGFPKNLTLYFVASVHEETYEGMNWQHIIEKEKIRPDAVLLTEPSNLQIIMGHRGRMDIKLEVKGLSSHGAEPDIGINAIYLMNPIISEIEKLHNELPEDPLFGKGSITITEIKSTSVSLNAVADSCTIHVDRRLGINDTKESVLQELKNLKSVFESEAKVLVPEFSVKSYKGYEYNIKSYYPSWKMDESDQLIQKACNCFKEQFDEEPSINYWRFSTNGVATKGLHDIPTVGFGPGDERFAHTIEEHIPIEHLLKATEFYISFFLNWAK